MRTQLCLAAIAICVATSAAATKPKHTPETPDASPNAASTSQSASTSAAQADSSSNAAANAHGGAGGSATSSSTSDASNGGVRIEHDVDALALSLPGQAAAPAVGGHPCLEHIRGGSGLSIGITGRTRFNDDCMELERARVLIEAGRPDLAVELLYENPPPAPTPVAPSAPTCELRTERVLAECVTK